MTIDTTPTVDRQIERLQERTGATSKAELVRRALDALEDKLQRTQASLREDL